MSPSQFPRLRRPRHGFALAGALAILVICAVVGVFFVKMFNLGQEDVARDAMGERAYQAAKAGADYGAYQSLVMNSCVAGTGTLPGIGDINVALNCQRTTTSEAGTAVTVDTWTIVACSAATCPGSLGPSYVERQMRISVAK